MHGSARIGVDVGGTFTDVVLALPDGRLAVNKTTTTPADPGEGVAAGIAAVLAETGIAPASVSEIVHGTTVGSNTILQKTGARTGLLTTQGFRDVLEIGRIRTPGMFDLSWKKPEPLVPRRWRREATERMAPDGSVVTSLDPGSVRDAAAFFLAEGIEAVAICFLHSYRNPAHEREALRIMQEAAPGILLTASCDVLPEIKEYERSSTAVVNAYLLPAMRQYLARLSARMQALGITAPVQVMASSGGMIGLDAARDMPVFAVGSGPAGGVTGAAMLGPAAAAPDLVAFDMGGTTAKAAIIEGGAAAVVSEYEFRDGISTPSRFTKGAGYMLKVPAIDIAEVGAGGGSLARIDAGGLLVVGPESAGGFPGPACYGHSTTAPTVTDANMVLGYLNPAALAGGSLKVDAALSHAAVERSVARPLGLSVAAAAFGIRALANAAMARAIRAVTVERGRDPRDLALLAFGGGGPLHAIDVAQLLGIARVLVAPAAGVFSAGGMLAAEAQHSFVHPVLLPLVEFHDAAAAMDGMAKAGKAALSAEGHAAPELRFSAELRYLGQSGGLILALPGNRFDAAAMAADFHAQYRATFGYAAPHEAVELVALRLAAVGHAAGQLDFGAARLDARAMQGAHGTRLVRFDRDGPPVEARLAARGDLAAGPIEGPAIIESYDTTIAVPPDFIARSAPAGMVELTHV
jgi:N-methylhydantoinase A